MKLQEEAIAHLAHRAPARTVSDAALDEEPQEVTLLQQRVTTLEQLLVERDACRAARL